jgi:hypothetical protein
MTNPSPISPLNQSIPFLSSLFYAAMAFSFKPPLARSSP